MSHTQVKHKISISSQKIRFLIAGAWNTIFGYGVGVAFYLYLNLTTNIFIISLVSNIVGLTMSFLSYKVYVFRTKGNWLREYLRAFVAYGMTGVIGVFCFWYFIEILNLNVWITQLCLIVINATVSYIMHKRYTFSS